MTTHAAYRPQPLPSAGRLLFFAVAAFAALTGVFRVGQFGLWFALVAIAIAIWHGAFDGVLAEEALRPQFRASWKLIFYVGYLALGAGVLILWWCAPVIALTAFLLYSALHFGTEAERELSPARLLTGLASGLVPIAAACHWWPQAATPIFALMLRGSAHAAGPITALTGSVLWPVVVMALLGSLVARRVAWLTAALLVATELVLFRGCTPVVAFALFFCLWHTPEHLLSTSTDRSGRFRSSLMWAHLRRGAVPWVVSLAGVAAACLLGRHDVQSYAGVVFIALSALTVPHMVLAEICRRNDRLALQRPRQILATQGMVMR